MVSPRFLADGWLTGMLRFPVSKHFPQGVYLARDLRRFFPDWQVRRIFDVGANEGQTAIQFALAFPKARIESFEPAKDTFRTLVKRTAWSKRIHCHPVALGSTCGTSMMMTDTEFPFSFRLSDAGTEPVTTTTVAQFCADHRIDDVNLLKIDTEGFDLEVLRGAQDLIRDQRIDLIQVEAGMNRENTLHVYFERFTRYLDEFEYRLFGIYDQTNEWPTRSQNLRRANLAFVSERMIYRKPLDDVRW